MMSRCRFAFVCGAVFLCQATSARLLAQQEPAIAENQPTSKEETTARDRLETAVRLVLPQRRDRLQELIEEYPGTKAAAEAEARLSHLQEQSHRLARRKLHEALSAPLIFDQRWRRLKEIQRDYPQTESAKEAEWIFERYAATVPPVVISNQMENPVDITVDTPYEIMQEIKLDPGEKRTLPTVFPLTVHIRVAQDEWDIYRASAGQHYAIHSSPTKSPRLHFSR